MTEFRMPSLGADMEDGILVEWLKQPGDPVARGDIVAVVETQKGAIEIEIFVDGAIDQLLVKPGTRVPVGAVLALVRAEGEVAVESSKPPPTAAKPSPVIAATPPPPPVPKIERPGDRQRVSPAARKLAAQRGIGLAGLRGSGPGGAIISADLEVAPKGAPGTAPAKRGIDIAEMRKAIGAAMARSNREIPHYHLMHHIDVSDAMAWLERVNADRTPPERVLFAAVLLRAVSLALNEVPGFNGHFVDNAFRPSAEIHLGTAVAIRGGGLVAPAIRDAGTKTLDELMAALRDLVSRTRAGRLRSSELFEPTVTVSSLGERGVEGLLGVIYPPQVALIGFGSPMRRPWVVSDSVEPRTVLAASLSADHRVSDGHRGALLLLAVERHLQQPEAL